MIYTVTFNPSIDYIVRVDDFQLGETNRSTSEEMYLGGKGINVSRILKELSFDSVALGFRAGFIGDEILNELERLDIKSDFVKLDSGVSRVNVKIKGNHETEINGQGPEIPKEAIDKLYQKLEQLKEGDILVLAGSIPNSLPQSIYEEIMERLSGKGIHYIVDATKDLLLNVLKYRPFLIKPNTHELGEIFNKVIQSEEEIISCANTLKEMGAVNVLVSMAKDGAILLDEKGNIHKRAPAVGKTVNSVGAGDSMVAGFLAGYLESEDYETALKLGTAAGSATAFSKDLATCDEIKKLFKKM